MLNSDLGFLLLLSWTPCFFIFAHGDGQTTWAPTDFPFFFLWKLCDSNRRISSRVHSEASWRVSGVFCQSAPKHLFGCIDLPRRSNLLIDPSRFRCRGERLCVSHDEKAWYGPKKNAQREGLLVHYRGSPARLPNIRLGSCCFFRAQASALHQQKERRSFSVFRLLRSFKPKEQKDQPLKFSFLFFYFRRWRDEIKWIKKI